MSVTRYSFMHGEPPRLCRYVDADDYAALLAENERMREALNSIASWDEGSDVNSSFDEPGSAAEARAALAGKPSGITAAEI